MQNISEQVTSFFRDASTTKLVCSACAASASTLYVTYRAYQYFHGQHVKQGRAPPPAPRGTVVLHTIPRARYAPSLSPFPIKLEMFLRLTSTPYVMDFSNPFSRKGKFPHMTLDGENVADSELCIRFLKDKLKVDLNKGLSPEQQGTARALQVMVDEHLYWTIVYNRWIDDTAMVQRDFKMPWLIFKWVQRKLRAQLFGQGMGRHTKEEIYGFVMSDLAALDGYLGNKMFMMGDVITEVDCSVFGSLCQFVFVQEDPTLGGLVRNKFPRLNNYVYRIKEKVWPDWAEVTTKPEKLVK